MQRLPNLRSGGQSLLQDLRLEFRPEALSQRACQSPVRSLLRDLWIRRPVPAAPTEAEARYALDRHRIGARGAACPRHSRHPRLGMTGRNEPELGR